MATANPIFDDLGISPQTSSSNPILSDLGINKQQTTASPKEDNVGTYPVSDEAGQIVSNIVKQTPRHLMQGVGALADLPGNIWDMAFHPEEGPHPMAHLVAEKLADRLQKSVPGLQPKNPGGIERIVGAAQEAAPSALLAGPAGAGEALLPTMASGAASQVAAEAGAGPTGQFLAGLTPFAPSALAAGARGLVRGGSEGAASMESNIQNAKNANINLSAGQLADNSLVRGAETTGAHLPFGSALDKTRGAGLNKQIEESVSNITKKLAPDTAQNPPTPTTAGEMVQPALQNRVKSLKQETSEVADAMYEAGGGKDAPASAPKLEAAVAKVTNPTGIPEVDSLVTKAKTKAVEKTVNAVSQEHKIPTSYSTDGEGAHIASSPNGETHATETATGDLKVTRSDTAENARGNGEGTSRLETLAHAASSQGRNLVSDISVSPAEAAAYEKLGRKGWTVEKNPNAEINPATGNIISDSPKNPVYTVRAPTMKGGSVGPNAPTTPNSPNQAVEWTYNPKTGRSEPVLPEPTKQGAQEPVTASLNTPTPWTLGSLKQLRTDIGQNIRRATGEAKRQLQTIYGAISDDLRGHMSARGPEAEQAWDLFNHVASQNAATQKTLTRAVKEIGGPEAAFKAAMSGSKDGATKLQPILSSLDPEGKSLFQATVLHRLGRKGGAADAPFDANMFLDNWKGMAPETKNALFGQGRNAGPTTQLRQGLDSLSNTMDLLKKQGYIKSGFVKGVEQGSAGYKKLGILGALVLLKEAGGEAALHTIEGHPLLAAGAVSGAVGALVGNRAMSRILTNPKTVSWLAQATKAPKGMVPILLNQLNQMGNKDPDAKDLYSLIAQGDK